MASASHIRGTFTAGALLLAMTSAALGSAPSLPLLADIAPPMKPERQERREQAANAATMLILGIATIGVAMIGLTILWGIRIRRNLRRGNPKSPPLDPLWYLRSKTRRPTHEPPPAADPTHRPSDPRDLDE